MPDVATIARRRFATGVYVRTTPGPGNDPSGSPRSEPPPGQWPPARAFRRRSDEPGASVLRRQFLSDVVFAQEAPADRTGA
jgi:hypothetical protein